MAGSDREASGGTSVEGPEPSRAGPSSETGKDEGGSRRGFRKMTAEELASCGKPGWRKTRRGPRCVVVCPGKRWRFVSSSLCGGVPRSKARKADDDLVPLVYLEPAELIDLPGSSESEKRK